MKNLINFFFSFEKLFKEKLIVPFFWLALIVAGLGFSAEALNSISLKPLANLIEFVGFFAQILLVLISIRIISEIFVAIFRINDNLSPDGGKGELADIDPVAEARKAAEMAASRTREMTKTAPKPAETKASEVKTDAKPEASTEAKTDADAKPKAEPKVATGPMVKQGRGRPKGSKNKPKTAEATAATKTDDAPVKRGRGRPKGSKNKPKAANATSNAVKRGPGRPKGSKNKPKSATGSKPGPKPGTKVRRDADGNLLKKDGTPRKKPGPKPKS